MTTRKRKRVPQLPSITNTSGQNVQRTSMPKESILTNRRANDVHGRMEMPKRGHKWVHSLKDEAKVVSKDKKCGR